MARTSTKAPGAVIEASLKKLGANPETLAAATNSSAAVINGLIKGVTTVTPEWSVKLGKALGESTKHFAELQLAIDVAAAEKKVGDIKKIRKALAKSGRKTAAAKPGKPGLKAAAKATAGKPAAPKAAGGKRGRPTAVK
jgi:addiction module HigA family antidote